MYLWKHMFCSFKSRLSFTLLSQNVNWRGYQTPVGSVGMLLLTPCVTHSMHYTWDCRWWRSRRSCAVLLTIDRIFSFTKRLSNLLQSQQCNLAKAANLQVAELSDVSVSRLEPKHHTRPPKRFCCTRIYWVKSVNSIQACNPHSKFFGSWLWPLTENYSIDHQSLEMEAKCTSTGNEQMEMISDVILQLQPIHWFTFCKVHWPFVWASPNEKRCCSLRIKSCLCSTMMESRLVYLASLP